MEKIERVMVVNVTNEHIGKGVEVFPSHRDDVATPENVCYAMLVAIKEKTGIDAELCHRDYRSYIRLGEYEYMVQISLSTWLDHCVERQGDTIPTNLVFYIVDGKRYVSRERVYNPNRISKSRARKNLIASASNMAAQNDWENRHPYNGYPHYYYPDGQVR